MTIIDRATDGRPPATQGAEVWESAVRAGMRLLAARPLHEVGLEQVAAEVGVPVEVVRQQIPDLNELLIAALQQWYSDRMSAVHVSAADDGAVVLLRGLLAISIADSACTRMVLTAASIAGSPGHPSAEVLRQMWVRFHAVVQRALAHDVAVGREPDTMDPASGAEQLLSIYQGLQLEWLLRPHMDLLAAYDRAATRMRRGWSERYVAPVWDV